MKIFTTIRNNWKKSLFGFCVFTYGTKYLYDRNQSNRLLQAYCVEAAKYNKQKCASTQKIRRITVFLNPISNNDRSKPLYDKYAAPLLGLSGLDVRLVRLDAKNEANDLMSLIEDNDTDCIVIAGGNRTVSEVLSGLLTRSDANKLLKRISIGIIPLGDDNSLCEKIFKSNKKDEIRFIGDSVLSIIKGKTQSINAMKVNLMDINSNSKTIYAFSNIKFGYESENYANKDKYWYYGPFKTRIIDYYKYRYVYHKPNEFHISYLNYCPGCKTCFDSNLKAQNEIINTKESSKTLIQLLFRKFISDNREQFKIEKQRIQLPINEECGRIHMDQYKYAQIDSNINDTPEGIKFNAKLLNKYENDNKFMIEEYNLSKFEMNFKQNANTLIIDNEIYDLNEYKSINVDYIHKPIELLYDSSLSINRIAYKSEFNLRNSLQTYIRTNSVVEPFADLYNYYLNLKF